MKACVRRLQKYRISRKGFHISAAPSELRQQGSLMQNAVEIGVLEDDKCSNSDIFFITTSSII